MNFQIIENGTFAVLKVYLEHGEGLVARSTGLAEIRIFEELTIRHHHLLET
ncbi:hypothetical protein N9D46_04620 [Chitinophagales bacterium]|nr:hypothetical protein [Chitinophagales bacterium]